MYKSKKENKKNKKNQVNRSETRIFHSFSSLFFCWKKRIVEFVFCFVLHRLPSTTKWAGKEKPNGNRRRENSTHPPPRVRSKVKWWISLWSSCVYLVFSGFYWLRPGFYWLWRDCYRVSLYSNGFFLDCFGLSLGFQPFFSHSKCHPRRGRRAVCRRTLSMFFLMLPFFIIFPIEHSRKSDRIEIFWGFVFFLLERPSPLFNLFLQLCFCFFPFRLFFS